MCFSIVVTIGICGGRRGYGAQLLASITMARGEGPRFKVVLTFLGTLALLFLLSCIVFILWIRLMARIVVLIVSMAMSVLGMVSEVSMVSILLRVRVSRLLLMSLDALTIIVMVGIGCCTVGRTVPFIVRRCCEMCEHAQLIRFRF